LRKGFEIKEMVNKNDLNIIEITEEMNDKNEINLHRLK